MVATNLNFKFSFREYLRTGRLPPYLPVTATCQWMDKYDPFRRGARGRWF
jgi:hypothetical protein